jgi:hypothetical protein
MYHTALAQDMDKWGAVVKAARNFLVTSNVGDFLTS